MNYLITGAAGFVGRYLIAEIVREQPEAFIYATDIVDEPDWMRGYSNLNYVPINLLDRGAVDTLVSRLTPQRIIHLASFSSVAYSWDHPADSFLNNSLIFINLIEALKKISSPFAFLSIGSSEEYGNVPKTDIPLTESHSLNATSPYAAARISQEMLSRVFEQGYGMDIKMTRSFNHIGPFQKDTFIVPSLIRQFVAASQAGQECVELQVGDIDVIRDFTDVRDVVRAYLAILQYGEAGEVYNVCSGKGISIRNLIQNISDMMGMTYTIHVDEARVRPSENLVIIGDNKKIRQKCGWCPEIDIRTTLSDTIAFWQKIMKS